MKRPKRLSATFVNTVNVPGRYGDGRGGHGLSLLCGTSLHRGLLQVLGKRCADPTFPWMSRLKLDTRLVDRRVCGCRMVIRRGIV